VNGHHAPRTQTLRRDQALLLVDYQKFRVGVAVCPRVQSSERVMRGGSGSSRAMNTGTFMLGFKVNLGLSLRQRLLSPCGRSARQKDWKDCAQHHLQEIMTLAG
jgi:hypothetical protein